MTMRDKLALQAFGLTDDDVYAVWFCMIYFAD